jgi:hypothetical protein
MRLAHLLFATFAFATAGCAPAADPAKTHTPPPPPLRPAVDATAPVEPADAGGDDARSVAEPAPGERRYPPACCATSTDRSARNTDGSLKRGPDAPAPVPGSVLLCYDDFGPQALASELLGMQWWSFKNGGSWAPNDSFDIRVVVYRTGARDRVRAVFRTDAKRSLDYRLVPYAKAIGWLDARIAELSKDCDAPDPEISCLLADTLRKTRNRILPLGGGKEDGR